MSYYVTNAKGVDIMIQNVQVTFSFLFSNSSDEILFQLDSFAYNVCNIFSFLFLNIFSFLFLKLYFYFRVMKFDFNSKLISVSVYQWLYCDHPLIFYKPFKILNIVFLKQ